MSYSVSQHIMASPVDSTAVIRMRKDFDAFISDSRRRRIEQPSFRLNLGADDFPSSKRHPAATDDSIKAVLEKEKEEKRKMAELFALQSRIAELETLLASTTTSNKRARIEFEKDLDSIKSEQERESEKISELRSKIRQLAESKQLAKAELAEGRREWEAARISLEGKIRTMHREKLTIEEEIHKVKEESWQQIMELKQESGRCLSELELIVIELEETKEQLKTEKRQNEELTEKLDELEDLKKKADTTEQKIKELEEQLSRQTEDAAVTRALRADIEKVPGLEKEVTRLRTENEYWSQQKLNTLLLEEQLTSVQKKLERAEKHCETFTELQVENEDLKARLHRWEALDASGSRRPQSPSALSRRVTELQVAEALALEEKGQLKSRISALELQLKDAVSKKERTQGELNAQLVQTQQHSDLIKRLRRKLLLVTKERDSFKRILDSYESEMTVPVPANNRVKELEEMLEGYQQHNTDLETQVERLSQLYQQATERNLQLERQIAQPGSSSSQDEVLRLKEAILGVELKLKKVTEEKENLQMRIEQRNMQGDYDPTRTKVVHLTMNPAAIAQQERQKEVDHLKEENEHLTARVQLLEQAGGPVEDLTMQVDKQLETVPESKVIDDLKSQLAKEELRKQRLVEAFKKTSQEFRETCYQLLGYKIDMPCTGQYRLASMYSESPHDYLLFKQGQSGEIQMLETDFSSRQQDKLEMYLQNRDSIPAFLSSITLDLFSQQTINMG